MANNSPSLDRIAKIVCDSVGKMDEIGSSPPYGVRFASAAADSTSFYATVHCVKLFVRYEQEIRLEGETRTLRGVFRARLDEPAKADQTLISSFSFDGNGGAESTGNFMQSLVRGEFGDLPIKENLALLLAHDVQNFIELEATAQHTGK